MSTNKKEICLKHQLILLTRNLIVIGYKKKFKISRPTITIWSLIQQLRTLKSEELANSLKIRKFESKFASKHGANFHAVAINSGTNAIFVILRYLKLNKDDEVIVPSFNFIAAANAVIMAGGKVKFVDVDPSTLLIDFDKLEKSISSRTKAVVIVHLFGRNVDLDLIKKFIKRYPDIQVIEDCAQSLGSEYADGQLSGTVGLASAFSFYPSKII